MANGASLIRRDMLSFVRASNHAHGFSEGLAAVEVNGKWGFIDRTGVLRIKPIFSEALAFQNGLAIVVRITGPGGGIVAPGLSITHVAGTWGYINRRGGYVWQSSD
jgi:hypothetical protein